MGRDGTSKQGKASLRKTSEEKVNVVKRVARHFEGK